jgi:K+-sensing histidine kinase KdpD
MRTLETELAGPDPAEERDPEATDIWEEKYWQGELEPQLLAALEEKFGEAGAALLEGPSDQPPNLCAANDEGGERRILVDQLVKMTRRMQRRVEQQHAKLEQQSRRLAAANRAKDLLLSRTGHDIKNGIGSILAHTTLAWAASGGTGSEQLDNIEETCQHLLQMLDALVDQAALASGAFSVRPMAFALEELVASVGRELREGPLRGKDQTLKLPDLAQAHVVHADPQRITQVLRNYLENASKFSHSGTAIELRVRLEGDSVAVEILDQGPGIPESSLPLLFEPMANIGNSPTDGEASSGLGLPVVADIIHRHGGEVWGRNREDGGAVFGFSLPTVPDDNAEPTTWSMG